MGETAENTGQITEKRRGRPENLRPWPKGVSGNPGGRPKGIVGKAVLRELRRPAEKGQTKLQALAGAQVDKAIQGDTRAAEFVRDSVDGRPSANDPSAGTGGVIVNILWTGSMPAWAQPSPRPPQENEQMGLSVWAQPKGDDESQRRDGDTEAQSSRGSHTQSVRSRINAS